MDIRLVPDCRVSVAGAKLSLEQDARLTQFRVDLDADLFGQCTLVFNDPKMSLINGDDFKPGVAIKVEVGFASKLQKIFEGEVVTLEPQFRRDLPPSLHVVCQESLHRLALSQMTRSYNEADDSDIVTKIAQENGFSGEGPSGTKEHILQGNISDAAFLRRIAQKHGNHVRIEGKKLIIGPPAKGVEVPIEPGAGLRKFKVRISTQQQIGAVETRGWDAKAKREIISRATPEGESGEGARKHGGGAAISIAGHEVPPGDTATAESMAKGRLRRIAEGFVRAQGQITGDPRILPGTVLGVDKIDGQVDGSYRVEHAEHLFSRHGYLVNFRAVRVGRKKAPANALAVPEEKPKTAATGAEQEAAKDRAIHGVTNPRWAAQDHEHGDVGEMIVDAKNIEGKMVEFVVSHQEPGGNWTQIARKVVVASGSTVSAKVKLWHDDHPDTPAATEGGMRPVAALLANPRWGKTDHQHGEEGEMSVDLRPGYDGGKVVFVVERNDPQQGWVRVGTVEGKVAGGSAKGSLKLLHPAVAARTRDAQAQELRFTAHLAVESNPRPVKFDAHVLWEGA